MGTRTPAPPAATDEATVARLKEAIETLEQVGADRGLLARLDKEHRKRFIQAVAVVDVVVEGRDAVAIFFEQPEGVVIGEVLELHHHAGKTS